MPDGLTGKGCTRNYSDFWRLTSVLKMQRHFTSVLASFSQTVLEMYVKYILINRCMFVFLLLAIAMY